ncbi:hypothetical protein CEP54_006514 [Fusarium duplospermum]|uniref:Uncharacterized protein n=1 Tax=Fusarium duplospermum TaxID=1325734 RepID=A0A428Q6I7_9HYPO|nr:hypothetical protein CEP54_006514 [Fusarium duplospermum]
MLSGGGGGGGERERGRAVIEWAEWMDLKVGLPISGGGRDSQSGEGPAEEDWKKADGGRSRCRSGFGEFHLLVEPM